MNKRISHIVYLGDSIKSKALIELALVHHYPIYASDSRLRTRITALADDLKDVHDFVFEYQELFDNSYWRIVDLSGAKPDIETHRPQYEGRRKDFVDVEWEFVIGHLSHPVQQEKLRRWANDSRKRLTLAVGYDDMAKSQSVAEKLRRRLPGTAAIEVREDNPEAEEKRMEELTGMAKYLNYFYKFSYESGRVPTELPQDEVDKAWDALDDSLKMSNINNVRAIPIKMEILGHDRKDWNTFYAMTAEEIDRLTEAEHNRWSVERLIQGFRPCTDEERKEVEEDLRKRLAEPGYAGENPISLKKRYKDERKAHYDLCAFSELGVDETGLPVSRYDRDLTAAIPLIVKTYNDHYQK